MENISLSIKTITLINTHSFFYLFEYLHVDTQYKKNANLKELISHFYKVIIVTF